MHAMHIISEYLWISISLFIYLQGRSQRGDMGACPPVTVGQFFHGSIGVLSGFQIPTNPILNHVDVD